MDERIASVLDHIEDDLSQDLSLSELASMACMSPGHFHKVFRSETGYTPFKFIEELKMNKAYQVILTGTAKVHELGLDFGYHDYETFSRTFKKHFAIAPDDLRAIAGKMRSITDSEDGKLVLKTIQVEHPDELNEMAEELKKELRSILDEHDLSDVDENDIRFVAAIPKNLHEGKGLGMVKNKYVITENKKLWQEIIKDGNTNTDKS